MSRGVEMGADELLKVPQNSILGDQIRLDCYNRIIPQGRLNLTGLPNDPMVPAGFVPTAICL